MEFEFDTVMSSRRLHTGERRNIKVCCFYGARDQNRLGQRLAPGSSPAGWNNSNIAMSADTVDMTKFSNRDDPNYQEVSRCLSAWGEEARQKPRNPFFRPQGLSARVVKKGFSPARLTKDEHMKDYIG
jgi:hypothetical protein